MANVSRAALRGVDLASAEKIIDYALKVARQKKLRPMTLAVLDSGGDLIAFKREDGTGIRRFDVVMGKAFGSLVMNRPSRAIGRIGENAPLFIQSLDRRDARPPDTDAGRRADQEQPRRDHRRGRLLRRRGR